MALKLDDEQQEVVDYTDNTIVIAGPGSGKTRILVAKAEKLYREGKDLICLTFTRAAAQEIRDRTTGILACTIHSYCYSVVGWPGSHELLLPLGSLQTKDKFEYVLVDEVQDLTEEQLGVVNSIRGGKLFAVGDPFQSIYGWNGALGLDVIDTFKFLGCKEYPLKNNYRSCPEVVRLLNSMYPRGLVSKGIKKNGITAILARTKNQVKEVSTILLREGVGFTARYGSTELSNTKEEYCGSTKLRVMTCHCSKGLEFDNVILYGWDFSRLWGEEKQVRYVSVSRASMGFTDRVQNEKQLLSALEGMK